MFHEPNLFVQFADNPCLQFASQVSQRWRQDRDSQSSGKLSLLFIYMSFYTCLIYKHSIYYGFFENYTLFATSLDIFFGIYIEECVLWT